MAKVSKVVGGILLLSSLTWPSLLRADFDTTFSYQGKRYFLQKRGQSCNLIQIERSNVPSNAPSKEQAQQVQPLEEIVLAGLSHFYTTMLTEEMREVESKKWSFYERAKINIALEHLLSAPLPYVNVGSLLSAGIADFIRNIATIVNTVGRPFYEIAADPRIAAARLFEPYYNATKQFLQSHHYDARATYEEVKKLYPLFWPLWEVVECIFNRNIGPYPDLVDGLLKEKITPNEAGRILGERIRAECSNQFNEIERRTREMEMCTSINLR
ncbi:MAG: hypothetical protein QW199_02405 [Candidatus Pacearchaeota archaeon]